MSTWNMTRGRLPSGAVTESTSCRSPLRKRSHESRPAAVSRPPSCDRSPSARPLDVESPEVHQALLAGAGTARRGELVLHEAGESPEFVHAPGTEPGVVVVEEDHGPLDRVRRVLELLVPRAHLRGLVLLHLVELRDLAVPDHPQVD